MQRLKYSIMQPVLLLAASLWSLPSAAQTVTEPPRELKVPAEAKPVPPPQAEQKVAVIELMLERGEQGEVAAELMNRRVVTSHAPKVAHTQGGSWQVQVGEDGFRYTINNPLEDIEIENPGNDKTPFSQVETDEPVEWTLIVPLYHDKQVMEGTVAITITDQRTKSRVLATTVDTAKARAAQ